MSSSSPKSIEQLDRNFQSAQADGSTLRWIDAFDASQVALRGLAWQEENAPRRSFRRLPDRAAGSLTEAVQTLSHCPAGGFLSFRTESRQLSVRVKLGQSTYMRHMPHTGSAGVELYLRDGFRWLPVATGRPVPGSDTYEVELFKNAPAEEREFRLYLPLYQHLDELAIGVDPAARVEPMPVPEGQKPIFVYGTSVTQGGCANTAGSDFVAIVGRVLETEIINFGFSGNGRGEPEVAELVREIDAEMFVLNFMSNCPPDLLSGRLPRFIEILREAHPLTPIVIVGFPCYDALAYDRKRYDDSVTRRDTTFEVYIQKRKEGDRHLHFIEGFGLGPVGKPGTFVDGVHPTSGGFIEMGQRLADQLEAIRLWERHWIAPEDGR